MQVVSAAVCDMLIIEPGPSKEMIDLHGDGITPCLIFIPYLPCNGPSDSIGLRVWDGFDHVDVAINMTLMD